MPRLPEGVQGAPLAPRGCRQQLSCPGDASLLSVVSQKRPVSCWCLLCNGLSIVTLTKSPVEVRAVQGNKTCSVLKLTVSGVMHLVSWLLVFWSLKSWGKAMKAQGFRLLILLLAKIPEKFCCGHMCKLCKPAQQGCDQW